MLTKFKDAKSRIGLLFMTMMLSMLCAVQAFAADGDTSVGSQLLTEFTSAAAEVKTLLIGIIGVCLTVFVVKIAYKAGTSFFKSGISK